MTHIAILYFSGYGHTVKQAEAVARGIKEGGALPQLIRISKDGEISDREWEMLDAADAIIFGSPTYMGAPAWQFKRVADASSKRWMTQSWHDKLAGGFTTSAATTGDKDHTLSAFVTLSQQHGQIWVGPGVMPASAIADTPAQAGWTGGMTGALAIARADSAPDQVAEGDMETAYLYGVRLAAVAQRLTAAA